MPEIRWSRFQFDPEAVIVIIYLNSLNAGLNDDITHFPHWEYIAVMPSLCIKDQRPRYAKICSHAPLDCEGLPEIVLGELSEQAKDLVGWRKIPVILGGEHTITAGALGGFGLFKRPVGVVQFDAHADLRDTYEGSPYNHACSMRRVLDYGFDLFQIGVRSLSLDEAVFRRDHQIGHLDAMDIAGNGVPSSILPDDFPMNIYISIDVDCLDPSLMPATGTPEPGGLTWFQMAEALETIISGRNVVGFDVVELAPIPGFHSAEFTVARLIYNTMGVISRNLQA